MAKYLISKYCGTRHKDCSVNALRHHILISTVKYRELFIFPEMLGIAEICAYISSLRPLQHYPCLLWFLATLPCPHDMI